jgi:RimJ/RimL family protein N-acetyltransferase
LHSTRCALELIEIQVETLFGHDENGRLRYVNEPAGASAPRFFLGRTEAGNIWRFRHDLPEDVVRRLDALCASEPVPTDLREAPINLKSFESTLQRHRAIQQQWVGPAYRFPDDIHIPTNIVRITQENAALLRPGFTDMIPRLGFSQPCVAAVESGRAVSLCCSVRISSRADEAGVETLRDYRGRGYATNVVAGWAMAVRELGRIPLYSTSWDNIASQRVASKLGLVLYGVDLHFT